MVGIEVDNNNQMTPERHEISQMVKCRMHSLGQPMNDYGKGKGNKGQNNKMVWLL